MPDAEAYEISETNAQDWNALANRATGHTVFSTTPWLDSVEQAIGERVVRLGCHKKGQLVAGVSGLECRGGSQLITPQLLPHGGFLFRSVGSDQPARTESEHGGATRALIDYLRKRYRHVHLTLAPAIIDVREFGWSGWQVTPRYTYVTDLTLGPDQLWERLERRTRTVIRKAETEGFRFERTDDIDDLCSQYQLLYTAQDGQPPVSPDFVRRLSTAAQERGLTESYRVVSANDETASVVVFAREGNYIYAWISGADPAFRDSGATSFLYWKFLQQTGYSRFDFVGANMPGIAFFKRGFAGNLVLYFSVQGFSSRIMRTAAGLRRLLR